MSKTVYLSAAFGRQAELREYRDELTRSGFEVCSRWLDEVANEEEVPANELSWIAQRNRYDLERSSTLIAFTEPSGAGPARGGRHVEYGYALARRAWVIIVGHRENVFHHLADCIYVETWPEAMKLLARWA